MIPNQINLPAMTHGDQKFGQITPTTAPGKDEIVFVLNEA